MPQKYMIPFFIGCFGAGCFVASRTASQQGMSGMATVWKILGVLGLVGGLVLLVAELFFIGRGDIE